MEIIQEPPCKIGDMAYWIDPKGTLESIEILEVKSFIYGKSTGWKINLERGYQRSIGSLSLPVTEVDKNLFFDFIKAFEHLKELRGQ